MIISSFQILHFASSYLENLVAFKLYEVITYMRITNIIIFIYKEKLIELIKEALDIVLSTLGIVALKHSIANENLLFDI